MAVKLTIGGEGDLGDVTPGWSVSEFVTPVAVGQLTEGTGSVSVTGESKPGSLLLVNNDATTVHENPVKSLGVVSGVVKTVSETGITASITHSNFLAFLDAELFIPPLNVGSLWAALDIGTQLTRPSRISPEVL